MNAPVEFGTKFDLSLDIGGYGRIEQISIKDIALSKIIWYNVYTMC
jgi:hypothetical protein